MHYNKDKDPVEIVIRDSKRKVVKVEDIKPSAVLDVYFERYKDYAGCEWEMSKTGRSQILARIRRFERNRKLSVVQHCDMTNYLFDYVFKPGFEPSLGSLVSDYFYNLWKSKSSARRGKFRKTSGDRFKKKRTSYRGSGRLKEKIEVLKKNGVVK